MSKVNRVKSLIYGQALADAVGAYTEFRTKLTLKSDFPTRNDFTFPPRSDITLRMNNFKRDSKQMFTDDTCQLILILDMLSELGKIDIHDFAHRLQNWINHGFSEIGQQRGDGVGGATFFITMQPTYLNDPKGTAQSRPTAANGSLMRTVILGMRFVDEPLAINDAIQICKCTHIDPRAVASCAITTALVYRIFHAEQSIDLQATSIQCVDKYSHLAGIYESELRQHCNVSSIEELDLDSTHMGYVLKCLGVLIWACRRENNSRGWKEVILDIVLQGGDADTNAAVTGAVLGLYFGYDQLPNDWLINLAQKEWLDGKIEKYNQSVVVPVSVVIL